MIKYHQRKTKKVSLILLIFLFSFSANASDPRGLEYVLVMFPSGLFCFVVGCCIALSAKKLKTIVVWLIIIFIPTLGINALLFYGHFLNDFKKANMSWDIVTIIFTCIPVIVALIRVKCFGIETIPKPLAEYEWSCLACNSDNLPNTGICGNCGCPSNVTAADAYKYQNMSSK
jgi:hypothetical protein